MTVHVQRFYQSPAGTISKVSVDGQFVCYCTERPWLNNMRNVSCIPTGEYKLDWTQSPRFGRRLLVHDVPNRSHILWHGGNAALRDTKGCFLPCTRFELTQKGEVCGWSSRAALKLLEGFVGAGPATLVVDGPSEV